jgi:hypothetical protein
MFGGMQDHWCDLHHQQYGKKFKVLGHCGPKEALKMVKKAAKRRSAA